MVYVFEQSGYYKIGYTSGLSIRRLQCMQTGTPNEITAVMEIEDAHRPFEKAMQEKYRPWCVRGEWFDLEEALCLDYEDIHSKYIHIRNVFYADWLALRGVIQRDISRELLEDTLQRLLCRPRQSTRVDRDHYLSDPV